MYKASEYQLGENSSGVLSPTIERQVNIDRLKAFLILNTNDLKSWLDLAALSYESSNFSDAIKAINNAWKINQEDRIIQQLRACIVAEYAIKNNNHKSPLYQAISLFESASEEFDTLAEYNIGNCYSALGQHEIAITHFDKALNQNLEAKQAAKIWNNRGRSMIEVGNIEAAFLSFYEALRCDIRLWNAYSSLAHLEAKLNNHEIACNHFEKAFQLNPDLEADGDNHLYCYSYSLYQLGRYKESLKAVNQLLLIQPIHEKVQIIKVGILAHLRREDQSFNDEALDFFKMRLLDNSKDMLARSELNLLYRDLGREEERRKLIKETVSLDNVPTMALYDYAMLLEHDGLIAEAIEYLEQASAKEKNHAIVHSLARLYRKSERYNDAIEYFRLALIDQINPLPILSEISDCYYLMGDYKSDIVVLTKILLMGVQGRRFRQNLSFALNKEGIIEDEYLRFLSYHSLRGISLYEDEILAELTIYLKDPSGYEPPELSEEEIDDLASSMELKIQEMDSLGDSSAMTTAERKNIIEAELCKVREGWNDTLILSDRDKEYNYVQFTETICEVSSRAYFATEILPLTEAKSEALYSLGFEQSDCLHKLSNYTMNWEIMSIDNMVKVVQFR